MIGGFRAHAYGLPVGTCRRGGDHDWTYSIRKSGVRRTVRWACMGCDAVIERAGSEP